MELNSLLIIGIIFFFGLAADLLGSKTAIPRVTFIILIGVAIGPSVFNILPKEFVTNWFDYTTTIALGMIGFLLGGQFTYKKVKKIGNTVFSIALGKVLASFFILTTILYLLGLSLNAALILASISTATAPAATYEIVHELKIKNRFTKTLLAIVAFDDILALILFSLVLSFISIDSNLGLIDTIYMSFKEIVVSIAVGFIVGYPIAKITGRIGNGEPIMIEALGSVFIICGIAYMLDLSPILTAMAMGSAVAAFAKHHKTTFHAIKHIEWPFMIIFFLLAGASLELFSLFQIGLIGIVYIIGRIIGIYLGANMGAKISKADKNIQSFMGFALIPQAGVAIGMALMAVGKHPEFTDIILPVVLGSTVFFEIVGPVITRNIIKKTNGEKTQI